MKVNTYIDFSGQLALVTVLNRDWHLTITHVRLAVK